MKRVLTKKHESRIVQKAINLFFLLFLFFGSLLGGMVAIFYQNQLNTILSDIKTQEMHTVDLKNRVISQRVSVVLGDLLFLSGQNELEQYVETGDIAALKNVEREYLEFVRRKAPYGQLRFLNADGMETVRVNNDDGNIVAVSGEELQDKSERYYFLNTIKLDRDEVFISPLDLNVEHDQIEEPFNPVVRFGTPVVGPDGRRLGVILINYLAKGLLDSIRYAANKEYGTPMLLNEQGYWLLSDNPDDEWGFMLDERKDRLFAKDFPKEWAEINEQETGQILTDNGLFTFARIHPLQGIGVDNTGAPVKMNMGADDYYWVLMQYIPQESIKEYVSGLRGKLFLFGAGVFVIISVVAWFLAFSITRRKIYQSQLISMALYDSLTSLPNRKLFFDTLESGVELAKRHGRQLGLLYIDLDGFKRVNDTLGHDAGDELLVKVSEILQKTTRKSDTVARLGGDEFAVILSEIDSFDSAEVAGNKIIQALCDPIQLSSGTVSIGASIGASVYPDTSIDIRQLIKNADNAMYTSKANGKNICTSATP